MFQMWFSFLALTPKVDGCKELNAKFPSTFPKVAALTASERSGIVTEMDRHAPSTTSPAYSNANHQFFPQNIRHQKGK
jgi:hypothetical protein